MRKFTLQFTILLAIVTFMISDIALAQSFFGAGTQKTPVNSGPTISGPVKSLSPADFKAQVQSLNQQTQNELTTELNQQLKKQPETPVGTVPAPPPTPEVTGPVTSAPQQPTSQPTAPPSTVPPVEAVPAPETTATGAPQQGLPQTNIPITPPPTQQQPIYSGFGNPNANTQQPPPANPPGQEKGGWNIKY